MSEWKDIANNMVPVKRCSFNSTCQNINGTWPFYVKHHVHGNRTHAFIKGYLFNSDYDIIPNKKDWYRSKEPADPNLSYSGQMSSTNWILNEVLLQGGAENIPSFRDSSILLRHDFCPTMYCSYFEKNKFKIQGYGIHLLRLQQTGLLIDLIVWENWSPDKQDAGETKPLNFDSVVPSKYFLYFHSFKNASPIKKSSQQLHSNLLLDLTIWGVGCFISALMLIIEKIWNMGVKKKSFKLF